MTLDNNSTSTTSGGGGNGINFATSSSIINNDNNDRSSLQQQQQSHVPAVGSIPIVPQQQHNNTRPVLRKMISNINPAIVKTGIFGASSNLINAIVGAGIIGIPYAIMQSGIVVGVLLLPIVGYLTHKSLCMIVNIATYHPLLVNRGVVTYEDLMYIPYGTIGKNFILCNMLIMAYGAMLAYLLIIKDTIPILLGYETTDVVSRNCIMLVSSFCIVVPLSMMRDISQLSYTSCISVGADIILVLIVVYYSPYNETITNYSGGLLQLIKDNWINSNVFIGLGVISTAMACQHSAFLISESFIYPTSKRWSIVTSLSLSISTLLTVLLGLFGYLGFLNNTYGDILLNFQNEVNVINIGRLLLGITMFLTYPMESFVARHVIIQLFYNGNMDNTTLGINGETIVESRYCYNCFGRREYITLFVYISTVLPALFLHDLGPVLSITGSLGASCISYIAPGLIYIGMNGTDFLQWVGASNTTIIAQQRNKTNSATNNIHSYHDATISGLELSTINDNGVFVNIGEASLDELPLSTATTTTTMLLSYKKPWWWYIALMPIWVSIASIGENGIQRFFTEFDGSDNGNENNTTTVSSPTTGTTTYNRVSTSNNDHSNSSHNENDPIVITQSTTIGIATATSAGVDVQHEQQQEIIGPNRYDYCFSIFFILFGVVAAIAGLTSNIWAIIQNIRSSNNP